MNRREMVQKFVVGGYVLLLVPSVLKSCTKDPAPDPAGGGPAGKEINLDLAMADNSTLNTAGASKVVQGIIIVNTGTSFIALSSVCTHEGCTVGYDSVSGTIKCPCHGSQFTTSGSIVNGPAPTPLKSYAINKTGTVLTIAL